MNRGKSKKQDRKGISKNALSVILTVVTSLLVIGYIAISSRDYIALRSEIESPNINANPVTDTTPTEIEVTTNKLPSVEPDIAALKEGQKTGLIGRDNPMAKLFLTEDDLDQIISELGVTGLSDEEMQYVVASLAVNTTKSYDEDKNFVIQTILEIEQEKKEPTTPDTNSQATNQKTDANRAATNYNSINDFRN
ncbi:hypothetical protein [Clostridium tertium]|uniref:hypothetical protein n=1 Tax=Clostridium tertium TaxID=1559 RepID=UPI0023B2F95E|nr:hypothetical protein [Clostridium tertium]